MGSSPIAFTLTHEDPAYLQIIYHYSVNYLKYIELKNFVGHQVWTLKSVH